MKKILFIIFLISIITCQQLIAERWVLPDQPINKEFRGPEIAQLNEIAVYGWFKFTSYMTIDQFYSIINLTQSQTYENSNSSGDSFFKFGVTSSVIFFGSYAQGDKLTNAVQYQADEVGQWFFFHNSYSFTLGKLNVFVKGPKTLWTLNKELNHKRSDFYRLFSMDQSRLNMNVFDGTIARLYFQIGKGSYKENDFDYLLSQNPETPIIPATCSIIYPECGYRGVGISLCEKKEIQGEKIKSIYIPKGQSVVIPNPANKSQKLTYLKSTDCIQSLNWSFSTKDIIIKKKSNLKRNN